MVKYISSELEFLARVRKRAALPAARDVVLGIGDDCAIFRPGGGAEDLLLTTDLLIEDIHFQRRTHSAADVGWKALARGLSDIAAMGGEPRFCLLSLALAPWAGARWVSDFYRGFLRLAARERVPLLGGDLARAEKMTCDIVAGGTVPRGRALRRDGARAGDAIYVSGALGGSALGMTQPTGQAWRRHRRPEPRLALGRFLREAVRATAAIDLSDGLSLDLHRLCLASRLSAEIVNPPIASGATLEQALHGGEDYELLFTASARARVPQRFHALQLTRIGAMRSGRPGSVLLNGRPLPAAGYDHLRMPVPFTRPRDPS